MVTAMRHLALALLFAACSSSPTVAPRDCTPGATSACVCPGANGAQTCSAEGRLGACVCPDAGARVDAASSSDAGALQDGGGRDVPLRPADPRCADRLTARDWCGPDDGGVCVDRQRDPNNCGGCGARCTGAMSECFDGLCFLPLDGGPPTDATR